MSKVQRQCARIGATAMSQKPNQETPNQAVSQRVTHFGWHCQLSQTNRPYRHKCVHVHTGLERKSASRHVHTLVHLNKKSCLMKHEGGLITANFAEQRRSLVRISERGLRHEATDTSR